MDPTNLDKKIKDMPGSYYLKNHDWIRSCKVTLVNATMEQHEKDALRNNQGHSQDTQQEFYMGLPEEVED